MKEKENNIKKLYNLKGITNNLLCMEDGCITIYEIGELCLLEHDINIQENIHSAYKACIRGIAVDYQILTRTDKIDMQEYIDEVSKKQIELLSMELKYASRRYIEYIRNLWKSKQIYITKYYLIVKDVSEEEDSKIKTAFKNMEDFGLEIIKVQDRVKINEILKKCINQR